MIVCVLIDELGRRGMSRRELSRLSGVNLGCVCALVGNQRIMIDLSALERICEVLGIEVGDAYKRLPGAAAREWFDAHRNPDWVEKNEVAS